eukprot:jgi/Chlat1/2832/Chrsp187S02976
MGVLAPMAVCRPGKSMSPPPPVSAAPAPPGTAGGPKRERIMAGDVLPLPLWFTNKTFIVLFVVASYYLLRRWREKIRTSAPLHILTWMELLAIIAELGSFIYLIGFFGIAYVQNIISKHADGEDVDEHSHHEEPHLQKHTVVLPPARKPLQLDGRPLREQSDEALACAVHDGHVPSHLLEKELDDCTRAVRVRRRAVELSTGRSLEGMPISGFDYRSALGACCEMVIGHVQVPVGVAGPLRLDGEDFIVPMATTEGCLVASTNRGCKAISASGGARSFLTRDGMTRAPAVRFDSAARACALKAYVESLDNRAAIAAEFDSTSRFARLSGVKATVAGRTVYLRLEAFTGDAMGMNMVSKGVNNVLKYLGRVFPDMEVASISGNFCADKKPTAINWIEGRGKSVICEVVISGDVVRSVLKTTVQDLAELNRVKNLMGSAMAGSIGGFNAHASNIVTAVFLATGQDPAQNVESSNCMTLLEPTNGGRDLHASVTMPSIEVGTVGGGTILASQGAALELLGVRGADRENPGANAQKLARIVAGAVLAGELSLMAALTTGDLVRSHMKLNRSTVNMQALVAEQACKERP